MLVAGVGGPPAGENDPAGWTTYVWVDSADDTATAVTAGGGRVLAAPVDIPHAGRAAVCADPAGAVFGLWQAAEHRGAQSVNAPGVWNFSELNVHDAGEAESFYGAVFGWECDPLEVSAGQKAWMWRVAGYGDFLADRDPDIRNRQDSEQAPAGFADAVALMNPAPADGPRDVSPFWSVTFAVADADQAIARASELGASIITPPFDSQYTRMGTVRDPQGAALTLSQYRPPSPAK